MTRSSSTSSTSSTGSKFATTQQDTVCIQTVQQFQPSVVQITITTVKGGGGLGSGTIIDSRGFIVTNYHVVEGATGIQVELYDGEQLPAQLTGVDPTDDLAVVQITLPHHMAVATIGDS
ncbi:MAG: trypsin-like peptidase domain-containing protein [Ktedonobacteraceae bacterium]